MKITPILFVDALEPSLEFWAGLFVIRDSWSVVRRITNHESRFTVFP